MWFVNYRVVRSIRHSSLRKDVDRVVRMEDTDTVQIVRKGKDLLVTITNYPLNSRSHV